MNSLTHKVFFFIFLGYMSVHGIWKLSSYIGHAQACILSEWLLWHAQSIMWTTTHTPKRKAVCSRHRVGHVKYIYGICICMRKKKKSLVSHDHIDSNVTAHWQHARETKEITHKTQAENEKRDFRRAFQNVKKQNTQLRLLKTQSSIRVRHQTVISFLRFLLSDVSR